MKLITRTQARRASQELEAAGGERLPVPDDLHLRYREAHKRLMAWQDHFSPQARQAEAEGRELLAWCERGTAEQAAAYLAKHPPSALCVVWIFAEGRRAGIAEAAGDKASKKNQVAREWVEDQWLDRTDKDQSKASFGRTMAPLVQQKFKVRITPDRIARYWIPTE